MCFKTILEVIVGHPGPAHFPGVTMDDNLPLCRKDGKEGFEQKELRGKSQHHLAMKSLTVVPLIDYLPLFFPIANVNGATSTNSGPSSPGAHA